MSLMCTFKLLEMEVVQDPNIFIIENRLSLVQISIVNFL